MDAWLERLRKEITDATGGLSEADWSRAPEGKWCSALILEHLARTYGTTAKMLELQLEANTPPDKRRAKFSQWMAWLVVVRIGHLPGGLKAPEMVTPTGCSGETALHRALENLARMEAALAEAEKRWGPGPVARHFLLGPMKATEWRKFHYVHGHHHLLQVRQRAHP